MLVTHHPVRERLRLRDSGRTYRHAGATAAAEPPGGGHERRSTPKTPSRHAAGATERRATARNSSLRPCRRVPTREAQPTPWRIGTEVRYHGESARGGWRGDCSVFSLFGGYREENRTDTSATVFHCRYARHPGSRHRIARRGQAEPPTTAPRRDDARDPRRGDDDPDSPVGQAQRKSRTPQDRLNACRTVFGPRPNLVD